MTHTPGPWAFEPSSGAIYYADGDVEPIIAGINQDGTSIEQADADGYLMAAAPDMLAALKAAMADFGPDFAGPTIDKMRAAIAKAENR